MCRKIGNGYWYKWCNGPHTLYPPYCFKEIGINKLNNNILKTNNDDAYYAILLKKMEINIIQTFGKKMIIFHNEIEPLKEKRNLLNDFTTILEYF